jgi:RNA polymerase sigma-70 factor (ECF subfamily)
MESQTSTHDLVELVKQGDHDAFGRLFDKYRPRLAVLAHYKLGSQLRRDANVDDILQETLLRAYRHIDQFRYQKPGSFMNWLTRIAGNVIAEMGRSQNRLKRAGEHVRFRSESNPGGPDPAHSHTPSRIFSENEALSLFLEKLDQLPEDYRRIILLSKVEGFTTSEVAERLGKTSEATALLLHRAIKRLRSLQEGRKE